MTSLKQLDRSHRIFCGRSFYVYFFSHNTVYQENGTPGVDTSTLELLCNADKNNSKEPVIVLQV